MKYHLLTGATGLLGRYLLRDLTLANIRLAVLVRKSKYESAKQRIETAMATWEQELGRALTRPVVIEGDITQSDLGLSANDFQWVKEYCDTMVHSAASLTFYATEDEGEPWRSNISGTKHVLDLCESTGIRKYHHVSTAYVCGQRRGLIKENELDEGQKPSNDYESSKISAEKMVRTASHLDELTVHRPSIIVGDSESGFTTSYHGFYTPLRLVHTMVMSIPWETIVQGDWLGGLSLEGDERKNLVPVQWVSSAMTEIIGRPELHGKTYHLTNPSSATAAQMLMAMAAAMSEIAENNKKTYLNTVQAEEMIESFRDQMKVYQSYWSDDPTFDSLNTQTAMPHLPCPEVDASVMDRLIRFAIDANFGWPREQPIIADTDCEQQLDQWMQYENQLDAINGSSKYINLSVSGSGGGQWHMVTNQDRLLGVGQGLKDNQESTCYLNTETFSRLLQKDLSWKNAVLSGRVLMVGNPSSFSNASCCFESIKKMPLSTLQDVEK